MKVEFEDPLVKTHYNPKLKPGDTDANNILAIQFMVPTNAPPRSTGTSASKTSPPSPRPEQAPPFAIRCGGWRTMADRGGLATMGPRWIGRLGLVRHVAGHL